MGRIRHAPTMVGGTPVDRRLPRALRGRPGQARHEDGLCLRTAHADAGDRLGPLGGGGNLGLRPEACGEARLERSPRPHDRGVGAGGLHLRRGRVPGEAGASEPMGTLGGGTLAADARRARRGGARHEGLGGLRLGAAELRLLARPAGVHRFQAGLHRGGDGRARGHEPPRRHPPRRARLRGDPVSRSSPSGRASARSASGSIATGGPTRGRACRHESRELLGSPGPRDALDLARRAVPGARSRPTSKRRSWAWRAAIGSTPSKAARRPGSTSTPARARWRST